MNERKQLRLKPTAICPGDTVTTESGDQRTVSTVGPGFMRGTTLLGYWCGEWTCVDSNADVEVTR